MWRDGAASRRHAVEIALIFAALLGTVGAFRIWWGGSASPGRPITSGLLLLALPIATAFRAAPVSSARRAAHILLLTISIGIAGFAPLAIGLCLTAIHIIGIPVDNLSVNPARSIASARRTTGVSP